MHFVQGNKVRMYLMLCYPVQAHCVMSLHDTFKISNEMDPHLCCKQVHRCFDGGNLDSTLVTGLQLAFDIIDILTMYVHTYVGNKLKQGVFVYHWILNYYLLLLLC